MCLQQLVFRRWRGSCHRIDIGCAIAAALLFLLNGIVETEVKLEKGHRSINSAVSAVNGNPTAASAQCMLAKSTTIV
jgi:hypothetical protein